MRTSRPLVLSAVLAAAASGAVALSAAPAVADGRTVLQTALTGAAEVPGPGDPDGRGNGVVKVRPGTGEVCVTVTAHGVEPLSAGHVHEKAEGKQTGGVAITLVQTGPTRFQGCTTDAETARGLVEDPADYYLNLHNEEFPAGALRGDLG